MKTLYFSVFFLLANYMVNGQIKVSFNKNIINTIEAKEEKIQLPISLTGNWPENITSFKIQFKVGGEAVKIFDYNIDEEEISIDKNNISIKIPTISIVDDKKDDSNEQIIIELLKIDSTIGEIDQKNNKVIINIIDDTSPTSDIVIGRVNNDVDTTEVIGKIYLNNENVVSSVVMNSITKVKGRNPIVFTQSDVDVRAKQKLKIDKVEISFQEGVISGIKVTTIDTVTRNILTFENIGTRKKSQQNDKRYPISIQNQIFTERMDLLPLWGGNAFSRNKFIYFKDVLSYSTNNNRNYLPTDIDNIVLTPKNNIFTIANNTSLSNYINLNIYSDFLSFTKLEKGNGLVQTEAQARFYLNTKNIKNSYSFFPFNYFEFGLKYSRFDNGYQYVTPQDRTIDRMLLNQRSFLTSVLRSNIYKIVFNNYSNFHVNAALNINWSRIRGDLISNDPNQASEYNTKGVEFYSWVIESRLNIPKYRNFGINIAYSFFSQLFFNKTKDLGFDNKDKKFYSIPEIEVDYSPIASSMSKVFLRGKFFVDNAGEDPNFFQIQIGYKSKFNFKGK